MSELSIRDYLHLDRESGVSLREQLQNGLYRFVMDASDGTRIPAERELQMLLGISRATIRNAILPLYRDGYLTRNRRQGTVVTKRNENEILGDRIQKMAISSFCNVSGPAETLTLMLYETIEIQKEFWEYAVHFFNATHRDIHIRIYWVPYIVSVSQYNDYLKRIRPDLFQYGGAVRGGSFARPLSSDLRRQCLSGEFHTGEKINPEKFCYGFSAVLTLWNESMAKQWKIEDLRRRIRAGEYLDILLEADRKLPPQYSVSGHSWDYFCFHMIPRITGNLKRQQVRQALCHLKQFAGCSRIFYENRSEPLEAVRHFSDGRQLLLDTHPASWQVFQSGIRFRTGYEPFGFSGRGMRRVNPMYLAVNQDSPYAESSEVFLEYMLSEPVQRQLMIQRKLIPRRISAWHYGAERLFQMSVKEADALIRQFLPCDFSDIMFFLIFAIQEDLLDFLKQKVDLDFALDQIMLKWNQYLLNQKDEKRMQEHL